MDTRTLRSFLKIADTGSISRAAESLGLAQPSLSQQLLRLEDEVGLHLFQRSARGVVLTEAGRVFREHARQILSASDQAIEDARHLSSEVSGEVLLAVPYSISRLAGLELVKAFMTDSPLATFRLVEASTGQIRGWLDTGKIDLGMLHDLGPIRHLAMRPMATEALYVVGPAGRFGNLADRVQISAVELSQLPMILPGLPHGLRQVIDREMTRAGVALKIVQVLDAMVHIGPLVAQGYGFSVLPLPAIADDLAAGRLSVACLEGVSMHRTICLVRNAGQIVTHASTRCEDLIVRVLKQLLNDGTWQATPDEGLR